MSSIGVKVVVTLDQFDTCDLLKELYNRIADRIGDPEPQHDPCIDRLTDKEINDLHVTLFQIDRRWYEVERAEMIENRKQYEVGIVGVTHIEGSWVGSVLFVKGRTCYDIMLPYPVCCMVMMLWKHTNARRLQKLKNKYKRT